MKGTNLIFDIGMHNGADTEFYLKKEFNVVAVEANAQLVEKASNRFKQAIDNGQLVIVNKAISDKEGTIDFFLFEGKDDWGTIYPDWNRTMQDRVTVVKAETVTMESLLEKYGNPYYMKIDIEGADILCLKSLHKVKERPAYISIELLTPDNFDKNVDALDILSHLKVLGYNKFLIADQSKNRYLKVPSPSLEGNYINHSFEGASSGLFGKELAGEWCSIDKIAAEYLNYFYKKRLFRNTWFDLIRGKLEQAVSKNKFHSNGWFDIHAKIEY